MDEHALPVPHFREVVIFLVAAGLVVPVMHRLRVSPVLGYLFVGCLIGPFGLGLLADNIGLLRHAVISNVEGMKVLAELGIIFLMFTIGLELSLDRLWAMRRLVFGLGASQVLVTAAAIGGVAWAWGNRPEVAIILGLALALSSTAIVMQLLTESKRTGSPLGHTTFAILLLQDIAVVPLLVVLGVLDGNGDEHMGLALLASLGKAVVAVLVVMVGGRLVLRPIFRMVASSRIPDLFMAVTLLAVVVTAAATGAAGLSMAFGAFLAGLILAESEYRHAVEVDIAPFKGLLLGLFFMTVGMGIDVREVYDNALWLVVAVGGLMLVKALVAGGLIFAFTRERGVAAEGGILLSQAGEFGFVIVGLAIASRTLPASTGQFMLVVISLTMVATPLVAGLGRRLGDWLVARDATQNQKEPEAMSGHVVIAGFGRVGRMLSHALDQEGMAYLAVDADPANVDGLYRAGLPVYFGNASRIEMLRGARTDKAAALVVTMDDPALSMETVRAARGEWPDLPIFVRARDARHAAGVRAFGATGVVLEAVEASLQLAGRVLESLGVPPDAVERRLELERDAVRDFLDR